MFVMFCRVCLFNNRSAWLIVALLIISSFSSNLEAQTFTKIVAGAIVNDGSNSTGASWADYDGDGFLDLFVANGNLTPQNDLLYRNNRNGTFTQITGGNIVTDGGSSMGGAWGDYDNDGDADLFVANRQGENNFLYRNEGSGAFVKITTGNIVTDGGNSNSSSWVDLDNDGDLDLYVINFSEADFLYRNDGNGTFTRITTGPPVTDISFSITGVWADYDNDGDLDLFISNGGNQNNFLYRNEGTG
ncbi:MAG: FG-GAP repeat domain-containing protein, partial [bacterium]